MSDCPQDGVVLASSTWHVTNNITLLALFTGGSRGYGGGTADSEGLERPLLDHKANCFKLPSVYN